MEIRGSKKIIKGDNIDQLSVGDTLTANDRCYIVSEEGRIIDLITGITFFPKTYSNWDFKKVDKNELINFEVGTRKYLNGREVIKYVKSGEIVESEDGTYYLVSNDTSLVSLEDGNAIYPLSKELPDYDICFRKVENYYLQID